MLKYDFSHEVQNSEKADFLLCCCLELQSVTTHWNPEITGNSKRPPERPNSRICIFVYILELLGETEKKTRLNQQQTTSVAILRHAKLFAGIKLYYS